MRCMLKVSFRFSHILTKREGKKKEEESKKKKFAFCRIAVHLKTKFW